MPHFDEANLCVVQGSLVSVSIDDVKRDGPAAVTVQDPDTGDLFVTSEQMVQSSPAETG